MKSLSNLILVCFILFFSASELSGQEKETDNSYKPLTLKLDESGDKYLRFIMWHQIWITSNNLSAENTSTTLTTSIRRSRMLAYAQISPQFLILTHFGLNGLTPGNLTTLGNNGDSPQLFLHGAWGELKIIDNLYIGAGLHYWKGLTRLASQSTLNFMTMDQSRPFLAWHSLGVTDQFARHLGLYLKGSKGKFEYRMAWNNPSRSPLGAGIDYSVNFNLNGNPSSSLTYTGVSQVGLDGQAKGNNIYEGYFKYNLLENESTKLPYFVGTYLGKKKVFSIGAGFFSHPNGMYDSERRRHQNVLHYAIDAFLDMPVEGGALNIYTALQKFDYGDNYISRWAGSGTAFYGQVGYYLKRYKVMPYLASSRSILDGAPDPVTTLDLGVNYFINGHNAKITGEYHYIANDYRESSISLNGTDNLTQFRLQLHIFL